MSDEVSLAQQQVSPHGLQMLQQQVVAVEDVQQILAGVKVGSVDLPLKRPLQVRQQLCSYESTDRNEKVLVYGHFDINLKLFYQVLMINFKYATICVYIHSKTRHQHECISY